MWTGHKLVVFGRSFIEREKERDRKSRIKKWQFTFTVVKKKNQAFTHFLYYIVADSVDFCFAADIAGLTCLFSNCTIVRKDNDLCFQKRIYNDKCRISNSIR